MRSLLSYPAARVYLLIGISTLLSCNLNLAPRDPEPGKSYVPATRFQVFPISSTTIRLAWKKAALAFRGGTIDYDVPPKRNIIERGVSLSSFSDLAVISGDSISYLDSNLDSTSTYYYRVRSVFYDSGYVYSSPVQIRFSPSFPRVRSLTLGNLFYGIIADVSRDGKFIAATYNDGIVHLLDALTGLLLRDIGSSTGYLISNVFFSTSGKYVAASTAYYDTISRSAKQEAAIYSVTRGGRINTFRRQALISGIAIDERDSILISSGHKPSIVLWNLKNAAILAQDTSSVFAGYQVAISPDGTQFVVGSLSDALLRIGRTNDGTITKTLSGHTGLPTRVAFSRDGQFIVSGSSSGGLIFWRAYDGQLLNNIKAVPTEGPTALAITLDNAYIIAGYDSGRIRFWNIHDNTLYTVLTGHSDAVTAFTLTDGGNTLFSVGIDKVNVWSLTPLNMWGIVE